MLGILIERIRFLCAWWRWVTRTRRQAAGLEALFTEPEPSACPIPLPNCGETCRPDPLTVVSSLNPAEVGRQAVEGETILDVAAWLEASGFVGRTFARDGAVTVWDAGRRQVYAAWLLKKRAAYERNGAAIP